MSECFCLLITGLVEGVLDSHVKAQTVSSFGTSWGQFPRGLLHRVGQSRLTAKCSLCCSEMRFRDQLLWSQCWLSNIFLFLLEGHFYSIVCIRWWATIFFKYLILWQVLLHLLPFTSYLAPGTFTQDSDVPSGKQSVGGWGAHTYSY